jgi:elongation factor P
MTGSEEIVPGMTLCIDDKIYRVDSCLKVSVAKGVPFMKTKLKDLKTEKILEKNFAIGQKINAVKIHDTEIEFLYSEGKNYLFLDIKSLDNVYINQDVISEVVDFLKEGVYVKARFYGDKIFSVELPQFLEFMVVKTESLDPSAPMSASNKMATLETGARLDVPMFIESGDIIKVDTQVKEYVQRV